MPFGCSQRYFCLAYKPALSQVRQEVLFVLEMKRTCGHEVSCEATREAGLRPMKRAFGSRRGSCALRFMATKLPLHTSVASASYRRKAISLTNRSFYAIINAERW